MKESDKSGLQLCLINVFPVQLWIQEAQQADSEGERTK